MGVLLAHSETRSSAEETAERPRSTRRTKGSGMRLRGHRRYPSGRRVRPSGRAASVVPARHVQSASIHPSLSPGCYLKQNRDRCHELLQAVGSESR